MDGLRRGAESAEIAQAVASVEILRKMLASRFPDADQILAELAAALRAHGVGANEFEVLDGLSRPAVRIWLASNRNRCRSLAGVR